MIDTVDKVHDRTTGPLLTLAAGIVYGTVAGVVLIAVLLLLLLILSRVLSVIPGPVWIEYAVIGLAFVIAGAIMWRKRTPS